MESLGKQGYDPAFPDLSSKTPEFWMTSGSSTMPVVTQISLKIPQGATILNKLEELQKQQTMLQQVTYIIDI